MTFRAALYPTVALLLIGLVVADFSSSLRAVLLGEVVLVIATALLMVIVHFQTRDELPARTPIRWTRRAQMFATVTGTLVAAALVSGLSLLSVCPR